MDEWTKTGDELRRLDPTRFVALLEIARRIVEVHRDPVGADVSDPVFLATGYSKDSH